MSEKSASERQARYADYFKSISEVVFWDREERNAWEFDDTDEIPPAAPDWFFLVNFPRTGSTVSARVLNRHPDIHCGIEEQVLPLFMTVLGSKLFMSPKLWSSVRYSKRIKITPKNMRRLMEAWRACVSEKPLFGDKGEMYYGPFGEACEKVFPGCRFLLTVRDPLDTLSSYIDQGWAGYMRDDADREALLNNVATKIHGILHQNARWKTRAHTIRFEDLLSRDGFEETFTRVFDYLGADPERYDWEAGWSECRHGPAVGRWRRDEVMVEFMTWIEERDPKLHSLLKKGYWYLPQEA